MYFSLAEFAFWGLLFGAFYLLRKSLRPYVLTAAAVLYCLWKSPKTCIYLILLTFLLYLLSILLQKCIDSGRKIAGLAVYLTGMAGLTGQFIVLKGFITDNIFYVIGLSFFSFQMLAYLVDIHRGKIKAEKNICFLLLAIIWSPKLISGPVELVQNITSQVKKLSDFAILKNDRLYQSLIYILYGFFCKIVLADRLKVIVDLVFGNVRSYDASWLILASLMYTLQIYLDFSGYSNIAIGISGLFGINLTQNFKTPYYAENISDFWNRWHISLSRWLKDYIYIPLGGNRKGFRRQCINLIIVFILCGFWHGKSLSFLVWGLLHGIFSCINNILKKSRAHGLIKGWKGRFLTFCEVSFAWIFFRSENLGNAMNYLAGMVTGWGGYNSFITQWNGFATDIWGNMILLVGVSGVLIFEYLAYRKDMIPCDYLTASGEIKKAFIVYLLVIAVLVFGVYGKESTRFIYMEF